jgi:DNA-directed RNA polymerase specialized sigma24 family protein
VCLPPEQPAPDRVYESCETKERVRRAIASLPARERKVIALYYYRDVTMKQIGDEIGVNESRVSQLHARAIDRLRKLLEAKDQTKPSRPTLVKKPAARPSVVRPRVRHEVEHRRVA